MLGDAPRGVMLNQKPIFLGGQGGLVGPCRLAYGTVVAAGTICRKDELRPDRLIFGGEGKRRNVPRMPQPSRPDKRIIVNNIEYISNLLALKQWYGNVRAQFVSDRFPKALLVGLKENLSAAITERISRLNAFCLKFEETALETIPEDVRGDTAKSARHRLEIIENWPEIEGAFREHAKFQGDPALRDAFLKAVDSRIRIAGKDYIKVIQGLPPRESDIGTKWLQGIVDQARMKIMQYLPSYRSGV